MTGLSLVFATISFTAHGDFFLSANIPRNEVIVTGVQANQRKGLGVAAIPSQEVRHKEHQILHFTLDGERGSRVRVLEEWVRIQRPHVR